MKHIIGLRIMVIIDRELLKRIDKAAQKAKVNRSAFLRAAAEEKMAANA